MEFNHLDPIGDPEDESRRRFRNHKLRRGVYILPSAFTVANLLCGYYAVLATLEGNVTDLDNASRAIGLAILFDSFDGRIARAMGTTSSFGREFDSLADVISFGIAPAFLAYAWGVRANVSGTFLENVHLVQLGWLVGFFFLVCCAWRLARFNIQGMAPGGNRFFVGMPTPAAAGMIAATVHFFQNPIQDVRLSILWLLVVASLGGLMSSTWRHYSFKDIQWTKRRPSLAVVLLGGLLAAIWFFSRQTLFAIAVAYTVHGVIYQVIRFARRRVASRPA
ncbi:MAG TPA: CDP-diacylglycerol--serine O-phosphatidyltransferase [Candidatus Acidoferrum sp.]|nr:CDP-diacylglycerol--serine O-phosphatidyltransferase [Candidatus Acidoferrum sp.]